MKALMTNSAHPHILVAKIRDQMYIKHLREVQKINNREALNLKLQLKEYSEVCTSHQKSKRKAKQFDLIQHNNEIQRKNQQMNSKIKNIRSMFNFNNLKKNQNRSESSIALGNSILHKENPKSDRYKLQNQEVEKINQINQHISQSIALGGIKTSRDDQLKKNRISLHYYLRKRQQEMIQHENQKLKKGILSQKSAYSPSKKLNKSLKLPSVKTASHNFNQKTTAIQLQNQKKQHGTEQQKIEKHSQTSLIDKTSTSH